MADEPRPWNWSNYDEWATREGHTCVVCGEQTDTCIAFRGSHDWVIAGLVTLGVPTDEAITMFEHLRSSGSLKSFPGPGRYGVMHSLSEQVQTWYQLTYVVCQSCVDKSGAPLELSKVDRSGELKCYPQGPE